MTAPAEVLDLIATAASLGAAETGGPLAPAERRLLARVGATPPTAAAWAEAIAAGDDPLGDLLARRRMPDHRRRLGAIYTPGPMVRSMVDWVLGRVPVRLVDAGCGSGRFAVEVARRRPDLAIVAVDVDPVATVLTRAALAVVGARRARVICGDYTAISFDGGRGRTAFIGNPPYVRHHQLSPAYKARMKRLAGALGITLSGLAGLHVHFFLATLRAAAPGDVGCFVTSAEWLDVGYGAALRQALAGPLGIEAVHLLDAEATPFADAMTTAVVACFDVGADGNRTVRLRRVAPGERLGRLDRGGRLVPLRRLQDEGRWTGLVRETTRREPRAGVRLGDLVRVSRGAVTGANAFFVLAEAEAVRRGVLAWTAPVLDRALDVLRAGGTVRASDARRRLLEPPEMPLASALPDALRRYLEEGQAQGVADAYVCRHRRPWWRVGAPRPPVVATYMARQPPAFALNPDRLPILNVLHGLWPKRPLDDEALARLVAWLNAHRDEFRGAGRRYQGGLEKFEPREMEALAVPRDLV